MNGKYIKSYTGLRAIAMLGVLFYHVLPKWMPGGYLGVVTFFVLAGFLGFMSISAQKSSTQEQQQDVNIIKAFFSNLIQRLNRLYPMILVCLAVCLFFMLVIFPSSISSNTTSVLGSLTFSSNITQIFEGNSYFEQIGILKPFTHLWALGIELQFHIMLFWLIYLGFNPNKKRNFALILGTISLLSYLYMLYMVRTGVDITRIYYSPFARFFSYSIGALSALILQIKMESKSLPHMRNAKPISAYIILAMIASFLLMGISNQVFEFWFFLYSMGNALLLYMLYGKKSNFSPLLNSSFLQSLGLRSYGIYLWHYPILKFQEKLFAHSELNNILYYGIYIFVLVLVSEISYRGFEMIKHRRNDMLKLNIALLAVCTLIPTWSLWTRPVNELDMMKQTILENERLQKEANAKHFESSVDTKKADVLEKVIEGDGNVKSGVITDEVSKGEQGLSNSDENNLLIGMRSLMFDTFDALGMKLDRDKFVQVFIGASNNSASNADKKSDEPKITPAKKSPSHQKAEEYVKYVNEFGKEVHLDLDKYAQYRLTKLLIIGDSIASMSYHTMQLYMPDAIIDGEHSRQFDGAYETFDKYLQAGDIGDFVVLALGTNGSVNPEHIDRVREKLGGRKLILISIVLPYKSEEDERNAVIREYAQTHDDVYLVEWNKVAKGKKGWFFEDNIHPGENGAKVYSQLIIKKIIEIIEGN